LNVVLDSDVHQFVDRLAGLFAGPALSRRRRACRHCLRAIGGDERPLPDQENSSAASHNERRPLRFVGLAQNPVRLVGCETQTMQKRDPWRATKTESRAHQNPPDQKTKVTAGRCLEIADLLARIRKSAAVKLLIVDELGYVPLSQTGAALLFEIFSQRHERGSSL
jgi:hypothetical protein